MIFQKQEIESKYRASGIAHLKSARKQQIQNSQMMSQRSSSQIASPRKQFKTQKGFQNSFAEPMQSTQYAGSSARLPSSPSDGRAPPIPQAISPRSLNKGKQREIDPSSEMDIHDLSDMELQGDLLDLTVDNEDNDEEAELELTPSNREEITAFLFDHLPRSPTCTSPTLFSLVNFDFPSDTEPTRLQEHRGICQSFFHCFSIRQTRDGSNAKNQESVFIRRLLIDILSLVRFFHAEELTRNEAMLGIDLILDLCQKFPSVVFSLDTDRFYYDYLAKQLFETIGKCINTERARLKAREAPLPKKTNAVTSGWSASKEESTRQEARRKILIASFEKEVEAYSCSLLHLIQYLALRPDPARLTQ